MNDLATLEPRTLEHLGNFDPARPAATAPAAVRGVDRAVVHVARDVMTRDPERVACSDPLIEVVYTMRSLLVAYMPVCDQNGDLQGIIALRDLQRVVRGADPTEATASSLAEEPAVTIGVNDPVDHVSDLMAEQRMWLLPVLDGRRLVGVIHYATFPGPTNLSARAHPPLPHAHRAWPREPDRGPPPRVRHGGR